MRRFLLLQIFGLRLDGAFPHTKDLVAIAFAHFEAHYMVDVLIALRQFCERMDPVGVYRAGGAEFLVEQHAHALQYAQDPLRGRDDIAARGDLDQGAKDVGGGDKKLRMPVFL